MPTETVQSKAYEYLPQHLKYLTDRGIDPAIARREGLRSFNEEEVRTSLANPIVLGGGLAVPYASTGLPPDSSSHTRIYLDDRESNGAKTIIPTGNVYPYILSTTSTTGPLFIVEAPTKALSLASVGHDNVIGLGGVSAGFFERGKRTMQVALEPYFPASREVYLVFDAGRAVNPRVAAAESKIARYLLDRKCIVRLVEIPYEFADLGPDDFIAKHGKSAFADLVANARYADPLEYAKSIANDAMTARSLLLDLPFAASLDLVGPQVHKEIQKVLAAYHSLEEIKKAWSTHRIVVSASTTGTTIGTGASWESNLMRSDSGEIVGCTENVALILENDPRWTCLTFNLLSNRIVFSQPPAATEFLLRLAGSEWTDQDDVSLSRWMHRNWGINYAHERIRAVVDLIAHRREFCPVQRRLSDLHWDGVSRVDAWLTKYLGVAATPYTARVGRLWLISAVARIFQPGCQCDYVLVLEGEQRIGKSTALRTLAMSDDFFTSRVNNVDDAKKAGEQLAGKWIIEFAELASVRRADVDAVKAFVTERVDRYRPAYGRSACDYPRRCVFAASINRVEGLGYLRDASGNERWWPVTCTTIDQKALERDRMQIWAEAVALHRASERWWPTQEERETLMVPEQNKRYEIDAWHEPIERHLRGVEHYTTTERILSQVLIIEAARHDQLNQKRIAQIMTQLGWESYRDYRRNAKGDVILPQSRFRAWRRTAKADAFVTRSSSNGEVRALDYEAGAIPILKSEDILQ